MKLTHSQEIARSRIIGNPYVIISGDRQVGKSRLLLDMAKSWYLGDSLLCVDQLCVFCHNHHTVESMRCDFEKMVQDSVEKHRPETGQVTVKDSDRLVQFGTVGHFSRRLDAFSPRNDRIGVFVDEAAYAGPDSKPFLESIARMTNVTKFVMISTPGPGEFFSEILETCTNHGPWLRPLFVHHQLECTDMDRKYFRNTRYFSDPELLDLLAQQQDINQRIQRILSKGDKS